MKKSPEKLQYDRDKRTLKDASHIRLMAKMRYGGQVGSFSMGQLSRRDMEMNGDAYKAAKREQEELRAKRLTKCPLCDNHKPRWFHICYGCKMKKIKAAQDIV